jgi:hypothetical protein
MNCYYTNVGPFISQTFLISILSEILFLSGQIQEGLKSGNLLLYIAWGNYFNGQPTGEISNSFPYTGGDRHFGDDIFSDQT